MEGALLAVALGLGQSCVLQSRCTEWISGVLKSDGVHSVSEQGFLPAQNFLCFCGLHMVWIFSLWPEHGVGFFTGFIFSAVPKLWVSAVTPGCQLSAAAAQKY